MDKVVKRVLKVGIPVILVVMIIIGIRSCVVSKDAEFEKKQEIVMSKIGDEVNLIDMRSIPGYKATGGFLLFTGSYWGETQTMIQFAWETKDSNHQVYITELPFKKISFNRISDKEADYNGPTVNFNLDLEKCFAIGEHWAYKENMNEIVYDYSGMVVFSLSYSDFASFRGSQDLQNFE